MQDIDGNPSPPEVAPPENPGSLEVPETNQPIFDGVPTGEDLIGYLSQITGFVPSTVKTVLTSLGIVIVFLLLRWIALRIVARRVDDVTSAYHWRRGVNYVVGVLMVLLVARAWFEFFENIATFLGLVSAGLAIALQDPVVNFAGWLFILTRRPYSVGDRVEIDGRIGDVIDIRLFQTYMLECGNWVDGDQTTGRIILVPNGTVFKTQVTNYTYGFQHIWDEIRVLITFESDWRKAKAILNDIANNEAQPLSEGAQDGIRRAASKHMIFFSKLTPIVYTTVRDSGVEFALRYLTLPRQRRAAYQRIWEAILDAFGEEESIDFAYPSMRYYVNHLEGKSEARAELGPDGRPLPAKSEKPTRKKKSTKKKSR